jgi:4'-phosphopantetheinyl transferase
MPSDATTSLLSRWTAKSALTHRLALADEEFGRLEIGDAADGARSTAGRYARPVEHLDDGLGGLGGLPHPAAGRDLGCDLELVEPRTELFVRDYLTADEADFVLAEPAGEQRGLLANLVWSATESALKVLRTGLRRDTRSVEVRLGAVAADGWRELVVTADEQRRFPGWWQRFGDFVLTVATDEGGPVPLPPPTPVVTPPGLAGTSASHTWMQQPRV